MVSSSSEWDGDSSDSDWSDDEENVKERSLLRLCEEGQLDLALERVRGWDSSSEGSEQSQTSQNDDRDPIRRQMFQTNADGNYALHEILVGGTTDSAAVELIRRIVSLCRSAFPTQTRAMFAAAPPSYGRTLLHWAAWCRADANTLRLIMEPNPDALCRRDGATHGYRTPLEIYERYWPSADETALLRRWTGSYVPHRVRIAVHLCAHRHFVTDGLTPFDAADRRRAGVAPRPWFVSSMVGFALQREMVGLALRILAFVGKSAKVDGKKKRRGRTKGRKRSRGASL